MAQKRRAAGKTAGEQLCYTLIANRTVESGHRRRTKEHVPSIPSLRNLVTQPWRVLSPRLCFSFGLSAEERGSLPFSTGYEMRCMEACFVMG